MSTSHCRPGAMARFDPERPARADLFRGTQLFTGLNSFEAGQSERIHSHGGADKLYLVISGKASMRVGEETFTAEAGDAIFAPAGVPHGVTKALERTVVVIVLSPPPAPR